MKRRRSWEAGTLTYIMERADHDSNQLAIVQFRGAGVQDDAGLNPASSSSMTEVITFGDSTFGALMRGDAPGAPPRAVFKLRNRTVVDAACSAFSSAIVTDAGEVYVAGLNDEGQLIPEGDTDCVTTPTLLETLATQRITSVAVSGHHTAVVNASGLVLTLGSNEHGALGHSEEKVPPFRVPPRVLRGLGAVKVLQVACGPSHTLLLARTGGVYALGSGIRGALGTGESDRREATRVEALIGVPIVYIAAGDNYSAAVSISGAAFAWGNNKHHQCGLEDASTPVYTPRVVSNMPELVQSVACGEAHTLWVARSGRVYACGRNAHGQCGVGPLKEGSKRVGSVPCVEAPTLVETLQHRRVREAACGARHSLLLLADGDLYAMGDTSEGATGLLKQATVAEVHDPAAAASSGRMFASPHLPTEASTDSFLWTPTRVPALCGIGIFRIAAGGAHSMCVRVTRGSAVCPAPGVRLPGTLNCVDATIMNAAIQRSTDGASVAPVKAVLHEMIADVTALSASFPALRQTMLYEIQGVPLVDDAVPAPSIESAAVGAVPAPGSSAVPLARGFLGSSSPWRAATFDGVLRRSAASDAAPPAAAVATVHEAAQQAVASRATKAFVPLLRRVSSLVPSADVRKSHASTWAPMAMSTDEFDLSLEDAAARKRVAVDVSAAAAIALPLLEDASTGNAAAPVAPDVTPASLPAASTSASSAWTAPPPPVPLQSVTLDIAPPECGPILPASLINATSGIDVRGLDQTMRALTAVPAAEVLGEMLTAQISCLDAVEPHVRTLTHPDSIRWMLPFWMLPTTSKAALSAPVVARLCADILALPQASRDLLIQWIGHDVPADVFVARFVAPLQAHLSYHLRLVVTGRAADTVTTVAPPAGAAVASSSAASAGRRATVASSGGSAETGHGGPVSHLMAITLIIRVLRLMYNLNERLTSEGEQRALSLEAEAATPSVVTSAGGIESGALAPASAFYNADLCTLPDALLQTDYSRWRAAGYTRNTTTPIILCGYPFLMDAAAKRRILQFEAAIAMQAEASNALARSFFMESPYLVLQVRRSNLLSDTLNQLMSNHPGSLKKPLKVVFAGEEAIDAGGVSKELFQLLIRDMFDPRYGMFILHSPQNEYWFNPAAVQDPREFYLVGLVFGLAIYNSILLDVHFPLAVYKKLLGQTLGLTDLHNVNPHLARGLQQLLSYDADDVEDVFSLTFEASFESFGEAVNVDLVPDGRSRAVTAGNKREYVRAYVDWYLNTSIASSFTEFMRGFVTVMSGQSLTLFRAEELQLLVAGEEKLDFTALERVTAYEGGYSAAHPTIRTFWSVVHALPPEMQRKLLVFTTGSPRAPIGGLASMAFKVQRAGPDSDRLPTASTCFNTLLLNDYGTDAEKMRDRLVRAVTECTGFGLK